MPPREQPSKLEAPPRHPLRPKQVNRAGAPRDVGIDVVFPEVRPPEFLTVSTILTTTGLAVELYVFLVSLRS